MRRGLLLLAVPLVVVSSCGNPTAKQAGERFDAATSVKIAALPSGEHLATITRPEDLTALAQSIALGYYGPPGTTPATLRLILMYPDGTKGSAYVDMYRTDGAVHCGWVNYDGIGPVFPSALFWEVLGRYVKP